MNINRDLLGFAEFKENLLLFINRERVSQEFLIENEDFIDYNIEVLHVKYSLEKITLRDAADILEHFLAIF